MRLAYYGHFDLPSDCENWIANALTRAGVLVYRWQRVQGNVYSDWNAFKDFIVRHDVDVVLLNKAPEVTVDRIRELRELLGCKVVWWTFDRMAINGIKEWFIPAAKASDICFMTDGDDSDNFYKNHGINRVELHQGFDPLIHRPLEAESDRFNEDIVFLGSEYTPQRVQLIEFLNKTYGSRFKHWGGKHGLRDGLWGDDFAKCVGKAKIVVGDNFTNDVSGYWSDRVYLTLACKSFFLTHYVNGLENEFRCGIDLDWWDNLDDLKSKIDCYLRSSIREKVKENGYLRVVDRDSYDNRVMYFIKNVEGIL